MRIIKIENIFKGVGKVIGGEQERVYNIRMNSGG